ncbi:hypothetical protein I3842_10G098500 [Carya illinoinensis]|uniref:CCHC-type domain-containing protein n=1 Tax=Carya illinoinensis TaxID=32201 RepID=A0A922DWF3_CARIL|nr:hypothetical protein I3842_10G098500 [Carya illinoinensis]
MTSSSSSPISLVEDPNSPFFLHHSDNANTVIISPPMNGSNYISWSRSFLRSISIKNKIGFLDGSISTPDLSDPSYVSWLRCNNILLAWILNYVSKEIASNVFFMTSAKQLYSCRPLPCCTCGKCTCKTLKTVGEVQQRDYVFKFLMGLNDSYDSVRGQIILLKERQRQARNSSLPISEPSALLAYQNLPKKKKEKSDLICHHCGKVGHTKDKCYKLVGFPPNFKFTKAKFGNNPATSYSANRVTTQVTSSRQESHAPSTSQLNLSQAQA